MRDQRGRQPEPSPADGPSTMVDLDPFTEARTGCALDYNNRGANHHARGDLDAALADFGRAIELDPRCAEAFNNRGVVRLARGDLDGARTDFDEAIGLNPCYAEAFYHRGLVRHLRDDFLGALADLDQALRINPHHLDAYIARGNARFHVRDPRGHADYRAAFLLDPVLVATKIVRKLAADLRSDPVGVLAGCDRHLKLDPDDLVAYARRGLTRLLQGRDGDAGRDFDQILLRSPDWKAHLELLIDEARRRRAGRPAPIFKAPSAGRFTFGNKSRAVPAPRFPR